MKKPISLDDAANRGLLVKPGIHTFSNGSEWDSWSSGNCLECRFFDPDTMGELCAFEGASFMHMVTPELATMFGWVQDPKWDKPDDHRSGWDAPEECPFFSDRNDEHGEPPPDPDPQQLVLIADPTEDIALPAVPPERVEVYA
ncbi:MAG: hypothetical protein M3P26_16320 [Gemmatimonadota bacterium]|nr:hypothetical protein [Gemmatimonadota bacterium]